MHHTHLQRPQVPGLWRHCRPSTLREPNVGSLADGRVGRGGITQSQAGRCLTDLMATINSCDDPHALLQRSALVTHIRRTYYSHRGRPVESADIVVPVAYCEIVYEIPVNRP